ncbi:MAG TPA: tRNA (N(6)-L-threonylcarbamoyladenosine(37)-C(2))-methylthiotransferase [Candidatus Nitrosocosmicus sp.]|nr:tRNA (N(6)-L-threonylcarbamoyladenosine(37)-C(2))-methylthiotransferase [Candidatus Nitrosocosmicus sp.]
MQYTNRLFSLKPSLIEKITLIDSQKTPHMENSGNKVESLSIRVSKKHNKNIKFWIEAYGCSANFSDMEIIAGILQQDGFNLVDQPEEADINFIVTCSVKNSTEHKMINRIKTLTNFNKPLVIAGCLPAADERMVKSLSPHASLIGPGSIKSISTLSLSALQHNPLTKLESSNDEKVNLPKVRINPIISIVQIATGCLSDCTFCQTKLAKGHLKSFRTGHIINQIKSDVEMGSKEIWLTSTDNGCYGLDIGTNIVNLLKSCEQIDTYFKIRLGMLNPMYLKNFGKELSITYSTNNKLFKFIHIPIQSGSESILKKMKRSNTVNYTIELVERLKNFIPNITIATDIITGFPSETDEDFDKTLKLLRDIAPDIVNSSKYSSRPGTVASKMVKVNDEIISRRSETLHKLIKNIALEKNSKWQGWKGEMLIDDIENGILKGRNDYYKSISLNQDPNQLFSHANAKYYKKNKSTFEKAEISSFFAKNSSQFQNPHMGKRVIVKVISNSHHTLNAIPLEIVN